MSSNQTTLTTEDRNETNAASDDSATGIPNKNDSLVLTYKNDIGNSVVIRQYEHHGTFIREVDMEWMYNYVAEQWEVSHRFTHDYELCDDGESLAGDGSNWRGTNREWRNWFTQRSVERLQARFSCESDEITSEVHEQDTDIPSEIADQLDFAS